MVFTKQELVNNIKSVALGLALMVILSCTGGCDPSSQPYPTDDELITFFEQNKEVFAKLSSNPENQELVTSLKINRFFVRSTKPQQVWYEVWYKDLFGPGGCMKGYAFSEQQPLDLVDSIDAATNPCGPEERLLYRKIGETWYLVYNSLN